jgi:hypothetical protein
LGDDLAAHIRDQFRCVPDEFVTGSSLEKKMSEPTTRHSFGKSMDQVNMGKKQVDILTNTLDKMLIIINKSTTFGMGKKEGNTFTQFIYFYHDVYSLLHSAISI